ncbi:MAG: hypothetical protein QFC55_04705 [Chloroflexota bacterium]|nr:hypothetical protein [Chloroflexota bacterium]
MSDDIERIPSMRKPSRQGVPKRKPREMAKPMLKGGKTKDAPQVAPRPMPGAPVPHLERPLPDEPFLPMEPTLALELELAREPLLEGMAPPVPIFEPEHEAQPEPEPKPVPEPEPEPEPAPEPEPEPVPEAQSWAASARSVESVPPASPAEPEMPAARPKLTLRQLVARVDDAFGEFRAAAASYPKEHMDERLGEDLWTRKQMLAHVAAWHDLTAERLIKMSLSGQSVALERDVDKVNANAARVAVGKTAGEVLKDVEATFGRMRRQLVRMTDVQLHADDAWAIHIVASNTYEHYADHIAELAPPEPPPASGARR